MNRVLIPSEFMMQIYTKTAFCFWYYFSFMWYIYSMKKKNIHRPFEIIYLEMDEDSVLDKHKQSFFELISVVSGTGEQHINNNIFDYNVGNLFLITPQDTHSLRVKTATTILCVRFTDIYIKSNMLYSDNIQRLEFILENANHKPGCILRNPCDIKFSRPLIDAIIREYTSKDLYKNELIIQLVNTLIVVVARNIAKDLPDRVSFNTCSETKTRNILQYIQANIYFPEKLRAKTIADHFGISEFYIGRYFKKHTNETMQQYIVNYKLKLIETRLLYSDLRINEIAIELGFTDESHMNKLFRKYRGITPREFRENVRWK